MIDSLSKHNTRVLTYISPFFSDPTNFSTPRRNFYQEGLQNGYFVQRRGPHGVGTEAYTMQSLSIQFCMLDFSNPSGVFIFLFTYYLLRLDFNQFIYYS